MNLESTAILSDYMSLIVAIRASDGLVLAADSRSIYSNGTYNDNAKKSFSVNNRVGILLAGDTDYALPIIKSFLKKSEVQHFECSEIIKKLALHIKESIEEWNRYNSHLENPILQKCLKKEDPNFGVIVAGYDRDGSSKIFSYDLKSACPTEIYEDCYCVGVKQVANYILKKEYKKSTMNEAIVLAKRVISETSDSYYGVGGEISIIKIDDSGSSIQ